MSFEIFHPGSVVEEVKRIVGEQIELIFSHLKNREDPHKSVHDSRKKLKKLRALVRLIRFPLGEDKYQEANIFFRDAGRRLSPLRDATARLETLAKLKEVFGEVMEEDIVKVVCGHLEAQREDLRIKMFEKEDAHLEVMALLTQQRIAQQKWDLSLMSQKSSFQLFEGGLHKVYAQGRKAFKVAYLDYTVENFHDWRKRVKYLRHHIELLVNCWPDLMTSLHTSLHHLGELLGDDHDLAVFEEIMETEADVFPTETREILSELLHKRSEMLRKEAFFIGQKIYAEKPDVFVGRVASYWQSWEWEGGQRAEPEPAEMIPEELVIPQTIDGKVGFES